MSNKEMEQIINQIDLTSDAPEEQTYRQYYFMEKMKEFKKAITTSIINSLAG